MAFTLRVFGHRGLEQIPVVNPKQFSSDAVYQLAQPYEWRDHLAINGLAVQSSTPQPLATDRTLMLVVEVPDGQAIRYEMGPSSRNVDPDANSPILSGRQIFYFSAGWVFKAIDAAGT